MKCPNCDANRKYKEGMVCGCGYRFALNPKEPPNLTDIAVKKIIDRISDLDTKYFTYNQLYAQIYRLIQKKKRRGCLVGSIVLCIISFMVLLMFSIESESYLPFLFLIAIIAAIVWRYRRAPKVSPADVAKAIHVYQASHLMDKLVDGKQFLEMDPNGFDKEILQFAPERILIADRDDTVDMLLLNRFHFENKALILSAQKYPQPAFAACQYFLTKFPDLPVILVHDASKKGYQMKQRLLEDKSWNLEEQNVEDLGLHPWDVEPLKDPIWMPEDISSLSGKAIASPGKSAAEKIRQGFIMPLDAAQPRAMMGMMGLAMVTGTALLSEEFLAAQRQDAVGSDGAWGGGFG
ncbi:hypothetical protein ACFL9U_10340 [Thermodesulfobacteriota bacterium]